MQPRSEVLLAAWAGVVGFAFSIAGGLMAGEFDTAIGGTPSVIVDFYDGAAFDGQFVTGVILETLGFLLLMAFVVGLASVAQGKTNGLGWLGSVVTASMIVATVLTLVAVFSYGAAKFRAANGGLVGDGYVVLSDIRQTAYWVSLPAWAVIFLGSGGLMVRTGSFPRWLAWPAFVIGIALLVVPFIDSVNTWDAVTGLGALWFLVTAIYMLVRPDRTFLSESEPLASG